MHQRTDREQVDGPAALQTEIQRERELTGLGEEPVTTGNPVEIVSRNTRLDGDENGMLMYGYKFRPIGFDTAK